jgi:hypothetical protein
MDASLDPNLHANMYTYASTTQAARETAKRLAIERGLGDIDRVRPRADPQDTGLIKGKGAVRASQEASGGRTVPSEDRG